MKTRLTSQFLIITVLAVVLAIMPSRAKAAYVLTLQQTADDVVALGSGSFNLSALIVSSTGDLGFSANVFPSLAQIIIGNPSPTTDVYQGSFTGPSNFGTTSSIEFADTAGGDVSGMDDDQLLLVPGGYTSGTELSGSAVWTGATFSSLGITSGTYVWSWGSGVTADSFTLEATISPVPEPATWGMLMAGVGVFLGYRRIRRRL